MGRRFVGLGAELIICGRRLELLEATAVQMRGDLGGKVTAIRCDIRDGADVDAHDGRDLARGAAGTFWSTNAAATFIAQTEQLSFRARRRILAPTLHGAMYCTLAAGKRWIEGRTPGRGAEHPLDLDHYRSCLHGALRDGEVRCSRDDQKPRVEWGPKACARSRSRPAPFPTAGATGQLRPEGPR